MLSVVSVAVTLATGVGLVGEAVVSRHRAEAAADLAALAGAVVATRGGGQAEACARAAAVAAGNGGRVAGCSASAAGVVEVVVHAQPRRALPVPWDAAGRARAGPDGTGIPP